MSSAAGCVRQSVRLRCRGLHAAWKHCLLISAGRRSRSLQLAAEGSALLLQETNGFAALSCADCHTACTRLNPGSPDRLQLSATDVLMRTIRRLHIGC